MMTHKFKVGDFGKTRQGDLYVVMLVDLPGHERYFYAPAVVAYVKHVYGWRWYAYCRDGRRNQVYATSLDLMPPKKVEAPFHSEHRQSKALSDIIAAMTEDLASLPPNLRAVWAGHILDLRQYGRERAILCGPDADAIAVEAWGA